MNKLKDYEKSQNSTISNVMKLKEMIEKHRLIADEAKEEQSTQEIEAAEHLGEIALLKESMEKCKLENEELRRRIELYETDRRKCDQLEFIIKLRDEQLTESDIVNVDLAKKLANTESLVKELQDKLSALEEDKNCLENKCNEAVEESRAIMERLQNELEDVKSTRIYNEELEKQKKLNERIANLTDEANSYRKEVEDLNAAKNKLTQELQCTNNSKDKMAKEINELKDKLLKAEQSTRILYSEHAEEIKEFSIEKDKANEHISHLKATIANLENEIFNLKNDKMRLDTMCAEVLTKLHEKSASLEKTSRSRGKEPFSEWMSHVSFSAEKSEEEVSAKVVKAESEKDNLRKVYEQNLDEMSKERERLNKELIRARIELENKKDEFDNDRLRLRMKYEEDIDRVVSENNKLNSEISRLSLVIKELEGKALKESINEFDSLTREIAKLKEDIAELTYKLDKTEKEKSNIEEVYTYQIEQLNNESKILLRKLAECEEEREEYKEKCMNKVSELRKLKEKAEKVKQGFENYIKKRNEVGMAEVNRLKDELVYAQKQNSYLTKRLTETLNKTERIKENEAPNERHFSVELPFKNPYTDSARKGKLKENSCSNLKSHS
eukprot:TRINITY_DN2217_c0_g3_i2.p1 TRINITY_DN2217_c0_g3~~TRINITY_DN2217_c0_g3_i2.p1  ORF type:complete len:612 (+),score=211.31 TRINITY_DN2217_c0_g3_i2:652-2487(+)